MGARLFCRKMIFGKPTDPGAMLTYNINDGFLEAVCRGYRKGILKSSDYGVLTQCDTLDDLKMYLQNSTDYGVTFLQNEPPPLHTTTISERATAKLVDEFKYMRLNAVEPLSTFLDYITYSYMIDNIVLLITGTLHDRGTEELIEKCHPLGRFEAMETITVAQSVEDLYELVVVETPLAPYFKSTLKEKDLDELNIEIIRNTLYKAYLEDFYAFCKKLGGVTGEVMEDLLKFEADRRSITITINSFGTELTKDDRAKLYPNFGHLYPEGIAKLAKCDDFDQVRASVSYLKGYSELFNKTGPASETSLDTAFFQEEVRLNRLAFEQQFHYGVFYSYVKLREQETRNIVWIAECIAQDNKAKINQYIPIF